MDRGQNFLKKINRKFMDHLQFCKDKYVLEIGTGHGELTSILCKFAAKVVSVELDKNLYNYSVKKFKDINNIELKNMDFMRIDLESFLEDEFDNQKDIVVCANIPYYITTPIIAKVLESERFSRVTLMMQKEVADKILSSPGSKNCSSLSVMVRYYSIPEFICDVPRYNFNPVPKVDSSVISFKTIKQHDVKSRKIFFDVVRASFSKRRKNVLNSISSGMRIAKNIVSNMLEILNLDVNKRAENLTFQNFVDISNLLSEKNLKN